MDQAERLRLAERGPILKGAGREIRAQPGVVAQDIGKEDVRDKLGSVTQDVRGEEPVVEDVQASTGQVPHGDRGVMRWFTATNINSLSNPVPRLKATPHLQET